MPALIAHGAARGAMRAGLPRAVRITLRDAATQQTLSMSTATMIHVDVGVECVGPIPPASCNRLASK